MQKRHSFLLFDFFFKSKWNNTNKTNRFFHFTFRFSCSSFRKFSNFWTKNNSNRKKNKKN